MYGHDCSSKTTLAITVYLEDFLENQRFVPQAICPFRRIILVYCLDSFGRKYLHLYRSSDQLHLSWLVFLWRQKVPAKFEKHFYIWVGNINKCFIWVVLVSERIWRTRTALMLIDGYQIYLDTPIKFGNKHIFYIHISSQRNFDIS